MIHNTHGMLPYPAAGPAVVRMYIGTDYFYNAAVSGAWQCACFWMKSPSGRANIATNACTMALHSLWPRPPVVRAPYLYDPRCLSDTVQKERHMYVHIFESSLYPAPLQEMTTEGLK